MCRYTTSRNVSVLKATIDNKTTSVTTHFKKLTTGNYAFIVSVIIYTNCCILQFLHQIFLVSALLLDDALLKCVVTEVVLFSAVSNRTGNEQNDSLNSEHAVRWLDAKPTVSCADTTDDNTRLPFDAVV